MLNFGEVNDMLNGISSNLNFVKVPSVVKQVYALVQLHERVLKLGKVTPSLEQYAHEYGIKNVPHSVDEFYPAVIDLIKSVATGPAQDALLKQAVEAQASGASAETLVDKVKAFVVSKCPPWISTQVDNFISSLQPPPTVDEEAEDENGGSNEVLPQPQDDV